jgi:hypothetical protein
MGSSPLHAHYEKSQNLLKKMRKGENNTILTGIYFVKAE